MKKFELEWNYDDENGANTALGTYEISARNWKPNDELFCYVRIFDGRETRDIKCMANTFKSVDQVKEWCADNFLARVAALPNELVFTHGDGMDAAECETVFGVFDCRETWLVIFRDFEQDSYGCLTDTKAEAQAIYRDLVRSLTNGNQEGRVAGLERHSLTYGQCYDLIESAQKDLDQPWRWSATRNFEVCLDADQFQDLLHTKLSADDMAYMRCEIFPGCYIVSEYPLKDMLTG